MMLRRSFRFLQNQRSSLLTEERQSETILLNRLRKNRQKSKAGGRGFFSYFRAVTASRLQGAVVAGGIVLGSAIVLGPWLIDEYKEMLGLHYIPLPPLPSMSPEWWECEWRKMNPVWRRGEAGEGAFYHGAYDYVRRVTGRDMSSADAFLSTKPGAEKGRSKREAAAPSPQALVPLCGDSAILYTLVHQGYEVDGVDCSETALRAATERVERMIPRGDFNKIDLHWSDIFAPQLWERRTGELATAQAGRRGAAAAASSSSSPSSPRYDVIYERQGFSSLPPQQREDYAQLLQQALKPDGVMYVEGIYRTGRVANNKHGGPPYEVSRRDLKQYFPEASGFHVRCEEKNDALALLSRESRVLQRVPKELYVTPFHCAVFRDLAVNAAERDRMEEVMKARPPPPPPTDSSMIHL